MMIPPPTLNRSRLQACCKFIEGRTVLVDRYHEAPLKITKTFREPRSHALIMYMMDVSPGLMEGDHYTIKIELGQKAHLVLSNQSFTKVHPARECGAAAQASFHVAEGACLEYMPEPTIPYEGSIFNSRNQFHLAKNATLVFGDIMTPGRTHRDERYLYTKCTTTTEIYIEDQLVAYDRFRLQPGNQTYAALGVLEQYTHQGALWIFDSRVNDKLLQALREELARLDSEKVLAAASMASRGGLVVRMVGYSVWELQELCQVLWDCTRIMMLEMEPCHLRK